MNPIPSTRRPTAARSLLPMVLGLLLGLLLDSAPTRASAPGATQGYQQAVASQMSDLIRREIDSYFKQHDLPSPGQVDIKAQARFDETGREPRIIELTLVVTLATDQPAPVIRQVRQQVARLLKDQGYQLEMPVDGTVDPRPLATLTIEATEPLDRGQRGNGPLEYGIFGVLVASFLFFSGLFVYLITKPFRSRKERPSAKRRSEAPRPQSDLPPVPLTEGPALGLSRPGELPLPPLSAKPEASRDRQPAAPATGPRPCPAEPPPRPAPARQAPVSEASGQTRPAATPPADGDPLSRLVARKPNTRPEPLDQGRLPKLELDEPTVDDGRGLDLGGWSTLQDFEDDLAQPAELPRVPSRPGKRDPEDRKS